MEKEAPPPYSYEPQAPTMDKMYPMVPADASQPAVPFVPVPVIPQPVVTNITTIVTALGPDSVRINCPHCQADISTTTRKYSSVKAYLVAGLLCLCGCVFGCCLIPFCMDSFKMTEHKCPNCKKFINTYSS